jgi:hypothetical protein
VYFFSANVLKGYEMGRISLAGRKARVPGDKPLTSVLSRYSLLGDFVHTSAFLVVDTERT